jgi:hypothetical protein
MYLSKPVKRILNTGLAAIAVLLIGDGLNRSLSNPQTYSDSELAVISKAAENGEAIVLRHKKTAAMIGVLEIVGGSIILALNALASDGSPSRILPKALDPQDTPVTQLPPPPQATATLSQRMMEVLDSCPQLKKCLGCESLIIIAPAGSGKSSIASAIAFLRAIIKGHKVYICDPHGEINVERGVWLIGKVFESEIDIISSAGIVSARRASKANAVTSIFDEFGSLCMDKNSASAKFASDRVGDAIRNNRKFFNYSIFLCHGRDKGQMGGEAMPTGYLAAWTAKSAVLELEADYNDESEAVFSGRAKLKPPGAAFDDDGAYERFVIPDFLNPTAIRSDFADLFHHLQIKGAAIEKSEPEYDPKTVAMVDQALDPKNLREIRQQMEALYKIQVEAKASAGSPDDDEYPDLAELNDEQWEVYLDATKNLSEIQRKLIKYFFSRKPEQLEADGTISIDKTYSNWGKNNKFTRPQVRDLLTEMSNIFLVKLTETHWRVRGSQNDQFPDL